MQYRKFGKLDWQVSALGFGCMRLPVKDGNSARIDEPEATRMLRYAIDRGVNYVDTAYPYHGGNSEKFVGRALLDGYRERVKLATKLPSWLVKKAGDMDRYLNEQLKRLKTDHVDFYLLHTLNKGYWNTLRSLNVLKWAEGAVLDGRVGHIGFSFHDEYAAFEEIVDANDWLFCQIQYNYLDVEHQAGRKGLHYAASKGSGVVIMEPLQGGKLAEPPGPVRSLFQSAPVKRTPVDWALQWLWNQPEVTVVLSGMSTMEQVEQNIASAEASQVGSLTPDEVALVEQARQLYLEAGPIACTQCEYCMPCPNGVNIPGNFELYHKGVVQGDLEVARQAYARLNEDERASACIQCRECEELCPQSILISEWMPRVHQMLGME